nr:MAG TPA: hypothetical protein [Caudoviricetes sp.]
MWSSALLHLDLPSPPRQVFYLFYLCYFGIVYL